MKRQLTVIGVGFLLMFIPAIGTAGVVPWGKLVYEGEVSSQTRENFQKAVDAVDELFTKYKIVLSDPVTVVVTTDTESYIQALMLHGGLSRAEAEYKAISPQTNLGASMGRKPVVLIRWIPTRQLTPQGASYLVNNPQESFALSHELFHQVKNQQSLVRTVNWLKEGPPELFRFMALETAGIKSVTDSVQLAERFIRRAAKIPETQQLASYDYETWQSLARQGFPVYHMAAIMTVRLIGDNGFEKVLFFYQLLHNGSDPDKAFITAFGVSMPDFLDYMNDYFKKLH